MVTHVLQKLRLELTAAELFREIVASDLDGADDLPSCSAIESLERQEPFINQTLALAMLAQLSETVN